MVAGLPLPAKPGLEQRRKQGRGGSLVRLGGPCWMEPQERSLEQDSHLGGRTLSGRVLLFLILFPVCTYNIPQWDLLLCSEPPLGTGAFVKHC